MDSAATKINDTVKDLKSYNEKVSVCIPTYKRSEFLRKLLESINEQALPDGVQLEIIVVDNDSEKSAEEVVNNFKQISNYNIRYYSQPQKNISLTRNMAVKEACGDYILFIDDDNFASPAMIKEHLKAIHEYDADIVFGMVKPYFHEKTPEWMKDSSLYYSPMGNTGSKARFVWSSNTMIKASVIKQYENPFNLEYGLSGGEDSYFFNLVKKSGYKLISSRDAYSMEFIPFERTTHKYFFTRAFKGGNTFLRIKFEQNKNKRLKLSIEYFIKGAVQIIFYSGKLLFVGWNKKERLKCLIKIYSNLGKIVAINGKKILFYK